MSSQVAPHGGGVLSRVLLLYGAYTLFHNVAFLFGYYLLSPGIMKKHPAAMIASRVSEASGFWWEFAGTLLVNLLIMGSICVLLNLQRVGRILNLPRFGGHLRRGEDASRSPHGEASATEVHVGVQGGGGAAGSGWGQDDPRSIA